MSCAEVMPRPVVVGDTLGIEAEYNANAFKQRRTRRSTRSKSHEGVQAEDSSTKASLVQNDTKKESSQDQTFDAPNQVASNSSSTTSDLDDEETRIEHHLFMQHVEVLRAEVNQHLEIRLKELVGRARKAFRKDTRSIESTHKQHEHKPRTHTSLSEHPGKTFVARDSFLTELLRVEHFKTIYNIFVAILIIFALNAFVSDIFTRGHVQLSLMTWTFGKFGIVASTWVGMMINLGLAYTAFRIWSYSHMPKWLGLTLYVAFQTIMAIVPSYQVLANALPPGSAMVVLCEQVRLMMKLHSFIRENVPPVLFVRDRQNWRPQEMELVFPLFSNFLYFLFAPTLIYRPNYPRTPVVHWRFVFANFAQVAACLLYTNFIFERFCAPHFRALNANSTWQAIVIATFQSMLPATMMFLLAFFAVLHSWLNAWAEMLRFADRQFYTDWWNAKNWAAYYRKWNMVVHDWLFQYIYVDTYRLTQHRLGKSAKLASMFTVFIISAIVHEHILALALGFFYPVLLVMFGGVGVFFIFLTRNVRAGFWNFFMWLMLFFGNGLLMVLYSLEFVNRQESEPRSSSAFMDFVVPRSIFG
ncbi:cholesterol acyltransferase [Capsaspora owczarzaki ATCC 30864]|uniref:cholesterol acyltransferase n=1 Tax=Capsaspora owczarzaki (strain ATCC 30864) TaxID=595528 RepID=UPI00035223DE|nr:cholesterol acyltransferase [Capsaspora owczarzaki ATCC 30864]|eukprot:XP_004342463.2 cholesterol acyltransferase [Capsaspora owczarzaki ATCC 30864]